MNMKVSVSLSPVVKLRGRADAPIARVAHRSLFILALAALLGSACVPPPATLLPQDGEDAGCGDTGCTEAGAGTDGRAADAGGEGATDAKHGDHGASDAVSFETSTDSASSGGSDGPAPAHPEPDGSQGETGAGGSPGEGGDARDGQPLWDGPMSEAGPLGSVADSGDANPSCVPKSADNCDPGNDDNCDGIPNEGCLCILGATRHCGICNDGTETCTDGKAGTYGPCTGASAQQLFYRDADKDGHGDPNAAVSACTPPDGYVAAGDDCCDKNKDVYPGNDNWYTSGQTDCPAVKAFDYDCDGAETVEYDSNEYGDLEADCGFSDVGCANAAGWATNPGTEPVIPPCGTTYEWVDCSHGPLGQHGCPGTIGTQTQLCR